MRISLSLLLVLHTLFVGCSTIATRGAGDEAKQPKLKSIVVERGTVYEVRYEGGDQPKTQLFRFHQNGKFDVMDSRGVFLTEGAQWKRDGTAVRVTAATNLNWSAEGSFTENAIHGTVHTAWGTRKFVGHLVDYDRYEFPLQEGEIIVLLRMKKYHPWPLPKGTDLKNSNVRFDDFPPSLANYGFEFEVLAPQALKGLPVTAHHDGDIASGVASAIAEPGKTYLWRTQLANIGGREFSICSIQLHWMKDTNDLTPDPRYRPGLDLLLGLGSAR